MAEQEECDTPPESTQGGPEPCCASASGQADCCSAGPEGSKHFKTIAFLVVVLLACVVAGHSLLTRSNRTASTASPVLSDSRAVDQEAVFVLLTDESGEAAERALQQMEHAAGKIIENGTPVGTFKIDSKSDDYALLTSSLSIDSFPSVAVLVKGCGSSVVSGQITEAKLLEAFLAASTPGSCCPANSPSCCPR